MKTIQDYVEFALKIYGTPVDAMIALDVMYANGDRMAGNASRKLGEIIRNGK